MAVLRRRRDAADFAVEPAFTWRESLFIIGVNDRFHGQRPGQPAVEPSFGQMFGFMLDSLFMDQLHADSSASAGTMKTTIPRIEFLVMTPSRT